MTNVIGISMNELMGDIQAAAQTLAGIIQVTPLTAAPTLGALTGSVVYLKEENQQVTGCCKARSAFYMLSTLSPVKKERGVVTVSTGNNGIANQSSYTRPYWMPVCN
jgi:threonine dehydratase